MRALLLILLSLMTVMASATASARHRKPEVVEDDSFPRFMNYYELVALPKYQQVAYVNAMRDLVVELAAADSPLGEKFYAESSSCRSDLYSDLLAVLFIPQALAMGSPGCQGPNCPAAKAAAAAAAAAAPKNCLNDTSYTCKDLTAAEKAADKTKVYASKNPPCLIGGNWSTYDGKAGSGRCKPVTKFQLPGSPDISCSEKGTAMCNPMLFGTDHSDGAKPNSGICVKPTANMTQLCVTASAKKAGVDGGQNFIAASKSSKDASKNGMDSKWNDHAANFKKYCGGANSDPTAQAVKQLNCSACKLIAYTTKSTNLKYGKDHTCNLDDASSTTTPASSGGSGKNGGATVSY